MCPSANSSRPHCFLVVVASIVFLPIRFEENVLAVFVALVTMLRGGDFINEILFEFSPTLFAGCR